MRDDAGACPLRIRDGAASSSRVRRTRQAVETPDGGFPGPGQKMVIAKILGGLGNQLFQYAMARSVAWRNGSEVKLDLAWFLSEEGRNRKFYLDRFRIKYGLATDSEIRERLRLRKLLGRDLYNAIIPFRRKRYIKLKEFEPFDGKYLELGGDVYLEGYWTDERYFGNISSFLLSEIALVDELGHHNKSISRLVRNTESVSIHIRRGDYVTDRRFRSIFNVCDDKYYAEAISRIACTVKNPCYFIFSDDIEWARKHIRTGGETVFVSNADGQSPHEELILMSMCRHNIIANSTFSWWGAWLNRNEGKTVIAPGKWFNLPGRHGGDCVPPAWSKIEID